MGLPKSAMQGILGGLLQGVDEHAQATIEQNRKQAEEQYAVHKQNLEGIIKSMRENPNNPYNPRHLVAAMGDLYTVSQGPQKKSRSLNFEDPKLNFLTRLLGGEIDLSPEPGGMHQGQNEARLLKLPEDAYFAPKEDGEERSDAPGTAEPVDQHSPLPVRMAEGPPPQAPETPHTATAAEGALADEMASAAQAVAQTPPPQYAGNATLGMPLGQPTGQIPTYAEAGIPDSLQPTPNPALSQSARSRMAGLGIGPPVARPQGPGLAAQLTGEYGIPRDRTGQWEGWTPGVAGRVPPMMEEGFERVEDDEPTSVGYGTGIITPDHRGRVQEEPSELFSGARTESDPYGLGHGWNEDDYLRTPEQTEAWKAHLASERLRSTLNTYRQAKEDYPDVPESVLQSLVGVQQGGQGPQISGGERWRFPDGNEHVLYTHRDGYRVDNNFQRTEIPKDAQLISTFAMDEREVGNLMRGMQVTSDDQGNYFWATPSGGLIPFPTGQQPTSETDPQDQLTTGEEPEQTEVGSIVAAIDDYLDTQTTLYPIRDTLFPTREEIGNANPSILYQQGMVAEAALRFWPRIHNAYRAGTLDPWLRSLSNPQANLFADVLRNPNTPRVNVVSNLLDTRWMRDPPTRANVAILDAIYQGFGGFQARPRSPVISPRSDEEAPSFTPTALPSGQQGMEQFFDEWQNSPAFRSVVMRELDVDTLTASDAYALLQADINENPANSAWARIVSGIEG